MLQVQQMCRTCLATHGELVPIFTNNYYVHNLPDKLKHTIRIEVSKDDDLPQMMCKKCVFLVDSLYCFKDQCEMAEVKLKKTLRKAQLNNTRKSAKSRDYDFPELDYTRDNVYSDALSDGSSEDEYHIEYVSEEARQAVENAKRSRRNAKKRHSLQTGVKVKSVEILPSVSKDKRSSSYQYELPDANEEANISDSDISSSYCLSEDSKKFSNKNSMYEKQQSVLKPGFKRKMELNNSYNRLTKVPKKVMFKDSEYDDDESKQMIEVTENPKTKKETKSIPPSERTLPSTKIDDKILKKQICSFNLTSPKKTTNNSMSSAEKPKSSKKDTDNKKVLEMHMQNLIKHVVLNNPKSCTICSDSFDSYLGMLRHRIQMHMNPEDKSFFCPICQERFFSHNLLIKHLDDHQDIYSFMCVLCNENFYTEKMLRTHLASHVNLNELTCIMCSLKFERISSLLSHLDEHVNKQLVCTFCIDTSFDSKDLLQSHITKEHAVSSEKAKPIPKAIEKKKVKPTRVSCPHCERNFTSESAVKDHITKKHQDFACLVCDKKFPTQDERNEHTKQSHLKPEQKAPTVQTPAVDKKKFLCRVCHEILISRVAYTQHLKEKHCSANQTNDILKELSETSQSEQPSQSGSKPTVSDLT